MPSSKNYKRSYRDEYDNYQGKPEQKKKRASRNAARAKLKKAGVKVAGRDVNHKNGNPKDNSRKNLNVQPKTTNRSFPRNSKAGKK